jgi:hypothetical protein
LASATAFLTASFLASAAAPPFSTFSAKPNVVAGATVVTIKVAGATVVVVTAAGIGTVTALGASFLAFAAASFSIFSTAAVVAGSTVVATVVASATVVATVVAGSTVGASTAAGASVVVVAETTLGAFPLSGGGGSPSSEMRTPEDSAVHAAKTKVNKGRAIVPELEG